MKKHQIKNNFTYFMKGTENTLKIMTCLFGAIIVSAVISIGAKANQTDWHDNTLSEQIQQEERAKAKAQWREENGIYQANLTPQVNDDMYRYVEQKQAEINRIWSK
ncbi:hypothetical protein [Haemophilus haemolyticus]|uniref:hypothetical protein n=1 Tax=Haemophilus haemolyticus TaxID=726 RepID=UPI000E57FB3D|nr:hypothetical protein [Haemophilus haemolyticus]